MKFVPTLDKQFRPMYLEFAKYKKEVAEAANKPLKICVERNDGYKYVYSYDIFASADKADRNNRMAERIIKTILWVVGGSKI